MARKKQTGITLIETMIVVAIIGILGAVALPAYNNYIKRAQVSEAINFANLAKIHLADYYIENGRFVPNYGSLSQRNVEIGLEPTTNYLTDYIEEIWVGGHGIHSLGEAKSAHVAVVFNATLFNPAKRRILFTIAVTPGGGFKMYCRDTGSLWWRTNQIEEKYVPKSCQGINSATS